MDLQFNHQNLLLVYMQFEKHKSICYLNSYSKIIYLHLSICTAPPRQSRYENIHIGADLGILPIEEEGKIMFLSRPTFYFIAALSF